MARERKSASDDWTPDQPLPDAGEEAFAQGLAAGVAQGESYREHIAAVSKNKDVTIRVEAHRLAQQADVASRVKWLRQQREDAIEAPPEQVTEAQLHGLAAEATQGIRLALRAAEKGRASASQLSAIRRALLVHVGRVERLTGDRELSPVNEGEPRLDVAAALAALPPCNCGVDL